MKLNQNEQKVLEILRQDPYISQKDLADRIHVSRPAVANVISGLQQKGYILGKPYVLREDNSIVCIGGANLDITLQLESTIQMGTSNPVISSRSHGGVIRNVAENLARLGASVSLMTLVGEDAAGQEILIQSQKLMNTYASQTIKQETTGSYYSVIDKDGNTSVGFADMSINRLMDRTWVLEHRRDLNSGSWLVVDLNVSKEAIEAIIEIQRNTEIPLAIIGVSSPKMKNLPQDLHGVDLIICNKDETQTYFKSQEQDGYKLCQMWLDAGVQKAVLTAGTDGAYYGEKNIIMHQSARVVSAEKIIDVTGAGDAFSSATIYGLSINKSLPESVKMGVINSSLTIQTPHAVNPKLSISLIEKEL